MKTLVKLSIAFFLFVAVLVGIGFLFLDRIAKNGIETIGSHVTQVNFSLAGISLSPLSGNGMIHGLIIGNPPGFKSPAAISVGSASLSLQPGTLFSPKVTIHSIQIDEPQITLEGNLNESNLKTIQQHINTSLGTEKSSRTFEVDDLLIQNGKVQVDFGLPGVKAPVVPLPTIHLTDLGKGPEGITASELTAKIVDAIRASATKTVTENLGDLGKNIQGLSGGATEEAGKALKGLGGLFK